MRYHERSSCRVLITAGSFGCSSSFRDGRVLVIGANGATERVLNVGDAEAVSYDLDGVHTLPHAGGLAGPFGIFSQEGALFVASVGLSVQTSGGAFAWPLLDRFSAAGVRRDHAEVAFVEGSHSPVVNGSGEGGSFKMGDFSVSKEGVARVATQNLLGRN